MNPVGVSPDQIRSWAECVEKNEHPVYKSGRSTVGMKEDNPVVDGTNRSPLQ